MIEIHPRYVTDENGKAMAVQLDLSEFEELLDQAELAAEAGGEDPDEGLELRPEVIAALRQQIEDLKSGKEKTFPASEVRRRLGL